MLHSEVDQRQIRVMVTGAGGPAAVSVMKSLRADESVELIAADMDPWAAGLYLVPEDSRTLIPAGHDPGFSTAVLGCCAAMGINLVIPTVDAELRPLAKARAEFARNGVSLMLAPDHALAMTLDKLVLVRGCEGHVRVPRTECLDSTLDFGSWDYPVVVKPRTGSGSRGVCIVESHRELAAMGKSAEFIVQEYLPGDEYSIDILADPAGHIVAAVPRIRTRVDSGVSVAGRTVHDPELEHFGTKVAAITGVTFIANVQCRLDQAGQPALLEVNPRVPGGLPLTMASGVDMARMALDSLRGHELPKSVDFCETVMVRFLEERFVEFSDVQKVSV